MDNMERMSKRLSDALTERNISAAEFARSCNVSRSAMSCYLNGKRMPSIEVAEIMSQKLGLSSAYIMGYDVEPNSAEKSDNEYFLLTKEEQILIKAYREADNASRMLAYAKLFGGR